jgi:hypothetical protein
MAENTVYAIGGSRNDFESASISPSGYSSIPWFKCSECGCDGSTTHVWYASPEPSNPQAIAFASRGFPEHVDTYEEYAAICDNVRSLFRTDARLLPGSMVGARPVHVRSHRGIGSLTTGKLKKGIDFIDALTSWVVSDRVFQTLRECGLLVPHGPVRFQTAKEEIAGYEVLELEPQPVYAEGEHRKYEISVCNRCGSSLSSGRGTFAMKKFKESLFREGYVILRGTEARTCYVNEALYQSLAALDLKGVSFKKAGEWV